MTIPFRHALDAVLAPARSPQRALAMRAYMRDQFEFLGIGTPERRALAKPLLKTLAGSGADALLDQATQLWALPQREYQYVALDLLAMHWKELNPEHIPPLLTLAQNKSWWDSVDGVASIVNKTLRHNHDYMDTAIEHENLWIRRIALLHQLGWRDKVDTQRLFNYTLMRAHEKEFFIQKAIGWALRDYAHHAPQTVLAFITKQKTRLSPLSYREANKHLQQTGVSSANRTRAEH
jgi:3-methyladenine DNA glycosylase AlkD